MDNDFQDRILASLERLTQDHTEIRQNSNELIRRIENIEATVSRIENEFDERLRAILIALETQIDLQQRILDALARGEKPEEPSSKGLFS
jgi:hypothetical protein